MTREATKSRPGPIARSSSLLGGLVLAILLSGSAGACEPEPAGPPAISATPPPEREIVFADRGKRATFDHGRALLAEIQAALKGNLTETTELGFKCANLRADQKAVVSEEDPLVQRFVADVDKICGLDLPVAAAQLEIRQIETKRQTGASTRSECLGLKLAIGDFDAKYASNPLVAEIGGKYAVLCPSG